jgi:hypothetical protein
MSLGILYFIAFFEVETNDRDARVFFLDLELDGEAVLLSKREYQELIGQNQLPETEPEDIKDHLKIAFHAIDRALTLQSRMPKGEEMPESLPDSSEDGQTEADMTSYKGEGDENPLESKIESQTFSIPVDCPEKYDSMNIDCKECDCYESECPYTEAKEGEGLEL